MRKATATLPRGWRNLSAGFTILIVKPQFKMLRGHRFFVEMSLPERSFEGVAILKAVRNTRSMPGQEVIGLLFEILMQRLARHAKRKR